MTDKNISRNSRLRVPRVVPAQTPTGELGNDLFSVTQGYAMGRDAKFDADAARDVSEICDADWVRVTKIPESASDLIVITRVKKLGAYIVAVTQKSPAKYRAVFVNRMHNLCLDVLADLLRANFVRVTDDASHARRAGHQTDAIVGLKMLGYVAMLAQNAGCILPRQHRQIAVQVADAVNLAAAWRKSDNEKWRQKHQPDLTRFEA